MHIIVASTNPVKIDSTRRAFAEVFPQADLTVEGVAVDSGVSDQPVGDAETLRGARTRVANARRACPQADFWVGLEGGVDDDIDGGLCCFAWMVVSDGERIGRGRTATFLLPDAVAELVRAGMELGDADDQVFGESNSKQKNGSVGLLTGDRITRTTYYTPAIVLALIPFMNPSLRFPS